MGSGSNCSGSVSYTHLDVYKRQGVTRIRTKLEIHGALSEADKARIIAEVASCPVCEFLSGPSELGKLD